MADRPICKVEGCIKPAETRAMCQMHYVRLKKHGTTDEPKGRYKRKIRWLREHAEHQGRGCLTWPFTVGDQGRGVASLDGVMTSAPRIMCILAHGEPPDASMQAAHTCGNGHLGCVNPQHLRWATAVENEADKRLHGTLRRGRKVNTAVLNEEDVRAIRVALGAGETGRQLAARYGVTPAAISSIKNGKSWAWLE